MLYFYLLVFKSIGYNAHFRDAIDCMLFDEIESESHECKCIVFRGWREGLTQRNVVSIYTEAKLPLEEELIPTQALSHSCVKWEQAFSGQQITTRKSQT